MAAPPRSTAGRPRLSAGRLLLVLMLAHAGLVVHASWRSSPTIDEFAHVPAGIAYWQTGTFDLYHHNPPLAKLVAALPVLASRPAVDYGASWARARARGEPPSQVEFGEDFMRANAARYFELFRRARLPFVLLSLAGMALVFRCARAFWGDRGGLLGAALWAFEPNLIAHAGLATTDLAATVLFFWALDALRQARESPSARRVAWAGVAAGLALLTKFTAIVLLPAGILLACWPRSSATAQANGMEAPPWPRRRLLFVPLIALVVLNLGYLFEGTGQTLGSFPFLSPALTKPRTGGVVPHREARFYQMLYEQRQNRFESTWLGALPVPLPREYLLGFDEQAFEANPGLPGGGYALALRGEIRRGGWWWYDLYALLVKLPLAIPILAMLAAVVASLVPAARASLAGEVFWIAPAAVLLAVMSAMTGLDIGVRYDLPVLPFLFVGIARIAQPEALAWLGRTGRAALAAALAWMVVGTLRVHPHELSYFNEIAGGPRGGARHLLDSNIDWGQDLLELRRVLEQQGLGASASIGLAYFGAVDPTLAGLRFHLPPRDPRVIPPGHAVASDGPTLPPGLYAVSVNFLYGLPHRLLGPGGESVASDEQAFAYFRALRPFARAGYSIAIFRVGPEEAARIEEEWRRPPARGR
ncbi:MAG TPA: glycosyltransferase family 39 protein [Candidatus Polarisedimenticolia bacterium]|nr:glycosyltransferase family 39 protein [Candidatus Polarisedimenticolia bacterium]